MNTLSKWLIGAAVAAFAIALPAHAYNDYLTHPQLTEVAVNKSNIYTDETLLPRLGLYPWEKLLVGSYLRFGAYLEDRGFRCRNHFFDPIYNRGLTLLFELGNTSYHWMLEDQGPISSQDDSLADARTYLTRALTYNAGNPEESERERSRAMIGVFFNLGATVHHLQDMAQPQHVRNDDHMDQFEAWGLNPLYKPSRYEAYTLEVNDRVAQLAEQGAPVYPDLASLKTARDFWFNGSSTADENGNGIAQWTNRNFVSAGTNFTFDEGRPNHGTYENPMPLGNPTPVTVQDLFAGVNKPIPPQIQTLCSAQGVDCTVMMYSTQLTPRASTLSIFDKDLRAKGLKVTYRLGLGGIIPVYSTERLFSLNDMNYYAAQTQLIPQAVSYSAGMINHFFRGKLDVSPPDVGPYAAVDHSAGTGFTTIKARVTNATQGQRLDGGNVIAIARFHVNNCYQADLSGEFTTTESGDLVEPCPAYRSNEEHIRVSSSQPFSFDYEQGTELTFQFSDEIPLSATDLVLQVYYQGKVGDEPGAFALGVADLSEPTFISVLNGTDVFELPTSPVGQFVYWRDITANIRNYPYSLVDENHDLVPDVNVAGGVIGYDISVDGKRIGTTTLPEGRFARVAVLVKPTTFELALLAVGNGFRGTSVYTMSAKKGQVDPLSGIYYVTPVNKRRNQALHNVNVTYYHYFRTANAPLTSMPESRDPDATTLVSVEMVTPLLASAPSPVATMSPLKAPDLPDVPALRKRRAAPAGLHAQREVYPVEAVAAAEAR